jgi:hypothetical protein
VGILRRLILLALAFWKSCLRALPVGIQNLLRCMRTAPDRSFLPAMPAVLVVRLLVLLSLNSPSRDTLAMRAGSLLGLFSHSNRSPDMRHTQKSLDTAVLLVGVLLVL